MLLKIAIGAVEDPVALEYAGLEREQVEDMLYPLQAATDGDASLLKCVNDVSAEQLSRLVEISHFRADDPVLYTQLLQDLDAMLDFDRINRRFGEQASGRFDSTDAMRARSDSVQRLEVECEDDTRDVELYESAAGIHAIVEGRDILLGFHLDPDGVRERLCEAVKSVEVDDDDEASARIREVPRPQVQVGGSGPSAGSGVMNSHMFAEVHVLPLLKAAGSARTWTERMWSEHREGVRGYVASVASSIDEAKFEAHARRMHDEYVRIQMERVANPADPLLGREISDGLLDRPLSDYLTKDGMEMYRNRWSRVDGFKLTLAHVKPEMRASFYRQLGKGDVPKSVFAKGGAEASAVVIVNDSIVYWDELKSEVRFKYTDPDARMRRSIESQRSSVARQVIMDELGITDPKMRAATEHVLWTFDKADGFADPVVRNPLSDIRAEEVDKTFKTGDASRREAGLMPEINRPRVTIGDGKSGRPIFTDNSGGAARRADAGPVEVASRHVESGFGLRRFREQVRDYLEGQGETGITLEEVDRRLEGRRGPELIREVTGRGASVVEGIVDLVRKNPVVKPVADATRDAEKGKLEVVKVR